MLTTTDRCLTIDDEYRARTRASAGLHAQACAVIPAGVTHDSRLTLPYPIYVARGAGPRKWDVDGNEYVDYFGGHGALLLGHSHPAVVEAVQRRGVRVTVVSTISSQPPMIADELRRQADVFTDLVELQSKLGRDPSERPAPREPRHHSPQFLQRATAVAPRGAGDDDFDD